MFSLVRPTATCIRYYETVGLLPEPERLPNGYRRYDEVDVARLQFVSSARTLGFSLNDIAEILSFRDRREAPCRVVLDMLQEKAEEVTRRITELKQLELELQRLDALGQALPMDDIDGTACVCHLIQQVEKKEKAARDGKG